MKPNYFMLDTLQAETSLQRLQVDLETAQAAKQRLEADNLALYSKIRYLQSYGGSSGTSGSGAGGLMYKSPQVCICTQD